MTGDADSAPHSSLSPPLPPTAISTCLPSTKRPPGAPRSPPPRQRGGDGRSGRASSEDASSRPEGRQSLLGSPCRPSSEEEPRCPTSPAATASASRGCARCSGRAWWARHGQMPPAEKDARDGPPFETGATRVLVATTVIRGRRRRAGGLDHGDRPRRELRARPASPASRPGGGGRGGLEPASCSTPPAARRDRAAGASRYCARPRTVSASPRRTSRSGARAT